QPVLEDDLIARLILREVQNDISALGHAQINTFRHDRLRQNVSVAGNNHERLTGAQVQLIETRRATVQKTEAILPRLDLKERLNDSINCKLVTQDAIRVERIERDLSIAVEQHVVKDQGNIILTARQSPGFRACVVFVSGIVLI